MHATWIRGVDDVLIRADAVTLLRNSVDGLFAETLTGRAVSADGRLTKVIIAVERNRQAEWRRESAETLIDLIFSTDWHFHDRAFP